jgi:hypothetical protein
VDVGHQRAFDFDGVVLLGLGAEVGQVVGRIIDAADEGALAVDHHDLAVHAAKQVGAPAPELGPGSNTCTRTPARTRVEMNSGDRSGEP